MTEMWLSAQGESRTNTERRLSLLHHEISIVCHDLSFIKRYLSTLGDAESSHPSVGLVQLSDNLIPSAHVTREGW